MESDAERFNGNCKNIKSLFDIYPVLKKIDENNDKIISKKAIFKILFSDEYLTSTEGTCNGILFVVKGKIKIQKINQEGEETNLYDIKQGELCHEALSCLEDFQSLNITGKAIQDSEVCLIPFEIVRNYIFEDNEFLLYMYKDLYKKFKTVIENKEEIMHEPLEARIIKLLMNKNSKTIYITHSELAFEVDSAREVVSRKLKSIEKRGYIRLERGKIIILKNLEEI